MWHSLTVHLPPAFSIHIGTWRARLPPSSGTISPNRNTHFRVQLVSIPPNYPEDSREHFVRAVQMDAGDNAGGRGSTGARDAPQILIWWGPRRPWDFLTSLGHGRPCAWASVSTGSSQDVDWVDDMRTTQRFSPRSPTLEGKEAAGTGVVVLSGGNRVLVNIEVTALYIQNSQSHGKRNLSELDWCLETSCRADELWSRVLYIQEVLWKLNTNISRHSNKLCYRFFFFFHFMSRKTD